MRIFDKMYSLCGFPSSINRKDGDVVLIDSPVEQKFRYKTVTYKDRFNTSSAIVGQMVGVHDNHWAWLYPNVPFMFNVKTGDALSIGTDGRPTYITLDPFPNANVVTNEVLGVYNHEIGFIRNPQDFFGRIAPGEVPVPLNGMYVGLNVFSLPEITTGDVGKSVVVDNSNYILAFNLIPIPTTDGQRLEYASPQYKLVDNTNQIELPPMPQPAGNIVATKYGGYETVTVNELLGLPEYNTENEVLTIITDANGDKQLKFIPLSNEFGLFFLTNGVISGGKILLSNATTAIIPPFRVEQNGIVTDSPNGYTMTIDPNKTQYFVVDTSGIVTLTEQLPADLSKVLAVNLHGHIINTGLNLSHLAQQVNEKFRPWAVGDFSFNNNRELTLNIRVLFNTSSFINSTLTTFAFRNSKDELSTSMTTFPTTPKVELTAGVLSDVVSGKVYAYPIYVLPDKSVNILYASQVYDSVTDIYTKRLSYNYSNFATTEGAFVGYVLVSNADLIKYDPINSIQTYEQGSVTNQIYVWDSTNRTIVPSITIDNLIEQFDVSSVLKLRLALKKQAVVNWPNEHTILDNLIAFGVHINSNMKVPNSAQLVGLKVADIVNFSEFKIANNIDFNTLENDSITTTTTGSFLHVPIPPSLNNLSHNPIEITVLPSAYSTNFTIKHSHLIRDFKDLTPIFEFQFTMYPKNLELKIGYNSGINNELIDAPCIFLVGVSNSKLVSIKFQDTGDIIAKFADNSTESLQLNNMTLRLPIAFHNVSTTNFTISIKNLSTSRLQLNLFLSTQTSDPETLFDLGTLEQFTSNTNPYFTGHGVLDSSNTMHLFLLHKTTPHPSTGAFDILNPASLPSIVIKSPDNSIFLQPIMRQVHSPSCIEYSELRHFTDSEFKTLHIYLRGHLTDAVVNNLSLLIGNRI